MRLLRAVLSAACVAAVVCVAAHGESPVGQPPGIATASPDDEAAAVEVARKLTKEVLARYGQCRREMGAAWKTLGRDFRSRHAAELRVFDNLPEAERAKLRNELRANVDATWREITSRAQFSEREARGLDRLMGEVGEAATALDRPTNGRSNDEASRRLAALEARYGIAAVELARRQEAVDRGGAPYDLAGSMDLYFLLQLLGSTSEKSLDINRREPVPTSDDIVLVCGSGGWCWMNPVPQGQW